MGLRGERSRQVKKLAGEAGFEAVGIAEASSQASGEEGRRFQMWLDRGRHGSMGYLARRLERRLDPRRVLPGCRSILCVALSYWSPDAPPPGGGRGRVARYAWGRDYHRVFEGRLARLQRMLEESFPGLAARRYVDTGPVLEKLWAERAGLGWRGKHTNLLSRDWGSWLLLGEILLDLDLERDEPARDHCGECTRCIDACPTGAITGPYEMDARRCISYLTIEHRGTIPSELRPLMGDHVFGCDDCLDVCPWNRFTRKGREADLQPRPEVVAPLLGGLVTMEEGDFRRRFAGTAVMRAKREGLARNACVVLGNVGGEGAEEALAAARSDASEIVREHASWALRRVREGRSGS